MLDAGVPVAYRARMVRELTINANTFPSGHVAGSLAVAFALLDPMPWAGGVCLLLAMRSFSARDL